MNAGVVFPQLEIGNDPLAIRDYAQAVEEMGYRFLMVYEHVLGANPNRPGGWEGWRPYTFEHPFHEPFVLFGYLAGCTRTLELVTGILVLPQRPTALVAKQAAEADLLSGGRLRLGVGIGWNDVEFEGLGYNFHNRGKRIEEQVVVLRKLWTEPLVTFKGRYHTLDDVGINPLPRQRPIPIWFGGMADVVLRRMARLGDGWFPGGSPSTTLADKVTQLRRYLQEEGRDPAAFGIEGRINLSRTPRAQWSNRVIEWRRLGATGVAVNTMNCGFVTLQEHIEALRRFKTETGL